MNVWTKLRALFIKPDQHSELRNKAGGMAWVRGYTFGGLEQMNGCAVRTVKYSDDAWVIDPPCEFAATGNVKFSNGVVIRRGRTGLVMAMADENLEPWRDDSNNADSEEKSFQPPLPKREILALPVKEM
jgi:hypothetical protein